MKKPIEESRKISVYDLITKDPAAWCVVYKIAYVLLKAGVVTVEDIEGKMDKNEEALRLVDRPDDPGTIDIDGDRVNFWIEELQECTEIEYWDRDGDAGILWGLDSIVTKIMEENYRKVPNIKIAERRILAEYKDGMFSRDALNKIKLDKKMGRKRAMTAPEDLIKLRKKLSYLKLNYADCNVKNCIITELLMYIERGIAAPRIKKIIKIISAWGILYPIEHSLSRLMVVKGWDDSVAAQIRECQDLALKTMDSKKEVAVTIAEKFKAEFEQGLKKDCIAVGIQTEYLEEANL